MHASNKGDHVLAARYYAAMRTYGGNAAFSLLHEARELGLAGERDAARVRLDAARAAGASNEMIEGVRRTVDRPQQDDYRP
jgi:hypothetical protein